MSFNRMIVITARTKCIMLTAIAGLDNIADWRAMYYMFISRFFLFLAHNNILHHTSVNRDEAL